LDENSVDQVIHSGCDCGFSTNLHKLFSSYFFHISFVIQRRVPSLNEPVNSYRCAMTWLGSDTSITYHMNIHTARLFKNVTGKVKLSLCLSTTLWGRIRE